MKITLSYTPEAREKVNKYRRKHITNELPRWAMLEEMLVMTGFKKMVEYRDMYTNFLTKEEMKHLHNNFFKIFT